MDFSVTILGTSSAVPNSQRNPSSQVVRYNSNYFLIDCGEGTQIQLRRNKINLSKINHIFISHLHGDHVYGLFGLLSTYSMLGREKDLNIYADAKLKDLIAYHNDFFNNKISYKLIFHALKEGDTEILFEDKLLSIKMFPLKHSIATHGFVFKEKEKQRNIKKYKIEEFNISVSQINEIKNGSDLISQEGKLVLNKELTTDPEPVRSFAYCSDTAYFPNVIDEIKNVDLLYHEATFMNKDIKRAYKTLHSTAEQAASIAEISEVKNLLLGHFSTRYNNIDPLLAEAKVKFENTEIAQEGKEYQIGLDF